METCKTVIAKNVEWRPTVSLRANPRNARTHSKRQIRRLANTIRAVGFIGAIAIDENGMVLAGHARLEAAKLNGLTRVPTIVASGLTEAQKRIFALADNKIAEQAGYDREILIVELGELAALLPTLDWDLELTGFEPTEIDTLFTDRGEAMPGPEDIAPSIEQEVVTRKGDHWILDRQRILCGDTRHQSSLDRLMGGALARMVFADVPYNVRISDIQGRGRIKHREFAHASGELSDPAYISFLKKCLGNTAHVSIESTITLTKQPTKPSIPA